MINKIENFLHHKAYGMVLTLFFMLEFAIKFVKENVVEKI